VAGSDRPHSHQLTAQDVGRIAEAFELPRASVLSDAALVAAWLTSEQALLDHLRHGHDWDVSMAPYYVFWIRGDGGEPAVQLTRP